MDPKETHNWLQPFSSIVQELQENTELDERAFFDVQKSNGEVSTHYWSKICNWTHS